MSAFLSVFVVVFLAEFGDKTQLATAMFAAEGTRPAWLVFIASSAALVASAGAATIVWGAAAQFVQGPWLKIIAGFGFIVIGALTLWSAFRPA